jgi:energy-coupling factor transport system ATP-binding protein
MALLEHTGYPGLHIEPGEVVALLGPPGSGKTRLALELSLLSKPERGEVLFQGENPLARKRTLDPTPHPREVTLLVQNAEDQLFARTVFDDVAFGPRRLLMKDDEVQRRVWGALSAVRLDTMEVRERSPFALSGGERRRVALAGVLAMEPKVLILDEPTASLDPRTRNEFLDLLEPLRGKSAIGWITASAREAALADRIYLLGETMVEVGSGADLFHRWRDLLQAEVELPPVYELAGALEGRGMPMLPDALPDEVLQAIVARSRVSRQ